MSKRGPGALGKSSVAAAHYVQITDTLFESEQKGACLQSAIANAFERLEGGSFVRSVQGKMESFRGPLDLIGHTQRLIHNIAPGFNLRKIQDPNFSSEKFKWMAKFHVGYE